MESTTTIDNELEEVQGTFLERVETERSQFRQLLVANPNYFGTLPGSIFQPVKIIQGNTTYEQLTCVGFNPKLDTLEATVQIKRASGYGGDLCSAGSSEYVRFYIDYGAGWEDQGVASFNAHSIAASLDCAGRVNKPLSYVVTLPIEPKRKYCSKPVLPKVRAILSWEHEPPPATPNWPPVWGNVLERHIQIKPRSLLVLDIPDLIASQIGQTIKLPPELSEVPFQPIPLPDPPPLAIADLVKLYGTAKPGKAEAEAEAVATSVEPHRFALPSVQAALAQTNVSPQALELQAVEWQKLGLNLSAILAALDKTKGNVSYEELHCLGMDRNREWLAATFTVKKTSGYSGPPCGPGSQEHVAFWADWDNTCDWTYLGTASISVHDYANLPAGGLHYTAIWPVNLDAERRHCSRPKIARIRAVLSWNSLPSTTNPDAVPHWGNRVDAHVEIRPGQPGGEIAPKISILGGVGVDNIFTATSGLTKPGVKFALWDTLVDQIGRSCPFGGVIHVQAPPVLGHKYRLWVRKADGTGLALRTDPVWVTDIDGVGSYHAPNAGGFYTYLAPEQNVASMLDNHWAPGGTDLWEIRLELFTMAEVLLGSTPWLRIQMHNHAPEADISVVGGACEEYFPGVTVEGTFTARDVYFGRWSLDTLPDSMNPPNPTAVPALASTSQTAIGGHPWQLDTSSMEPCGYVVVVHVWDRTIVGSHPGSHNYNKDDFGFCLLKP